MQAFNTVVDPAHTGLLFAETNMVSCKELGAFIVPATSVRYCPKERCNLGLKLEKGKGCHLVFEAGFSAEERFGKESQTNCIVTEETRARASLHFHDTHCRQKEAFLERMDHP